MFRSMILASLLSLFTVNSGQVTPTPAGGFVYDETESSYRWVEVKASAVEWGEAVLRGDGLFEIEAWEWSFTTPKLTERPGGLPDVKGKVYLAQVGETYSHVRSVGSSGDFKEVAACLRVSEKVWGLAPYFKETRSGLATSASSPPKESFDLGDKEFLDGLKSVLSGGDTAEIRKAVEGLKARANRAADREAFAHYCHEESEGVLRAEWQIGERLGEPVPERGETFASIPAGETRMLLAEGSRSSEPSQVWWARRAYAHTWTGFPIEVSADAAAADLIPQDGGTRGFSREAVLPLPKGLFVKLPSKVEFEVSSHADLAGKKLVGTTKLLPAIEVGKKKGTFGANPKSFLTARAPKAAVTVPAPTLDGWRESALVDLLKGKVPAAAFGQ